MHAAFGMVQSGKQHTGKDPFSVWNEKLGSIMHDSPFGDKFVSAQLNGLIITSHCERESVCVRRPFAYD